jgi:hypothetical protein
MTAPQSPPTSGERERELPYAAFGLQVCRLHGGYVDRVICDAKDRDSAMAIAAELNWLADLVAPCAPEPSEAGVRDAAWQVYRLVLALPGRIPPPLCDAIERLYAALATPGGPEP